MSFEMASSTPYSIYQPSSSTAQIKIDTSAPPKKKYAKNEIDELMERGVHDVFKWEDDDIALRAAAQQSRVPFEKMTSQEMAAFSDIADTRPSISLYLYIRNKILQMWQLEPNVELAKEHVYNELIEPYNSDLTLVRRIHSFLERYGYINFGTYHRLSRVIHVKKRVIIVGAGVAGMAACKQLKDAGFDVVLLEGRGRVGGRVHTYTMKTGEKVDLGAMIVTGVCGNPLVTLARQFPVTLDRLNDGICSVYDSKGRTVEKKKDVLVEKAFNTVGDIASYVVHEKGVETIGGKKIDLETAYENICCLMEVRMQKRRLQYYETLEEMVQKVKALQDEMVIYKKSAEFVAAQLDALDNKSLSSFNSRLERDVQRKCFKRDLQSALKKYDQVQERRRNVEASVQNLRKMQPSEVYMNEVDRRIFDFHLANLEYANGTVLRNLSLKYWDQDDENELLGSHMTVREGMSHLIGKMTTTKDVLLERVVENISYDDKGATVLARHSITGKVEEYKGDAVLVTLPLGVLKKCVEEKNEMEKNEDTTESVNSGDENINTSPVFDPPLPEEKVQAIKNVGYGSLNKVILLFDSIFWEEGVNFYGTLGQDGCSRGELFMFHAPPGRPILIGLLAGDAANTCVAKEAMVGRAMHLLGKMFGSSCPLSPKEAIVTIWHMDPFTLGCYSYMSVESEADDYDRLAAPVKARDENGGYTGVERLFFAGEHTNRNYPATVHGAFLSGLREAGRIADSFSGCPYATPENDVVDLDDEEDDDCIMEEKYATPSPAASAPPAAIPSVPSPSTPSPSLNGAPPPTISVPDDDGVMELE